jgi:iron(III) transport system permease protein
VRRSPLFLALPALATVVAVNLPLIYLFVRAGGSENRSYLQLVFSRDTGLLLVETLLLVAGVIALALAIALPTAWVVARTDLPARRFWAVVGALPLVFPSYVAAFSLVAVLGPRGFVQGWLEPLGVGRLPDLAYGYSGALLALALFTYPYIYIPLVAALRGLDPALEESSRTLGADGWTTFRRIVVPQLRPAMIAGSLLVALYTLSDFGAVSIVRYNTMTLGIFNAYAGLFDRSVAAALATVLVLLAGGLVLLENRLVATSRASRTRAARPAPLTALGAWKWPSIAGLSLVALLAVVLPTGVALFWGLRAVAAGNPLGTAWSSTWNSLGVSLAAALCTVVLALPIAAWAVRYPQPLSRIAERLSYMGNALPGLVIALSVVFFATRFAMGLYQTLALLIAAYAIRFLPQAVATLRTSLATLSPLFEEAARSLGRGPLGVLTSLTLPLIRPGLLAGLGLVFLTTMKELPATLILRPTGFDTLATRIWTAASEGIYSEAALPSLLLLAVTALPVHLLFIRPMLAERS